MKLPVVYDQLDPFDKRRVREAYVLQQKGECYYCKRTLGKPPPRNVLSKSVDESLFPDGFFSWPVHLHHSHDTGLTLGAVHAYCNAVLWQYHGE